MPFTSLAIIALIVILTGGLSTHGYGIGNGFNRWFGLFVGVMVALFLTGKI